MLKAMRWLLCLTLGLSCAPVAAEEQAPGEAEVRTAVRALARIGAIEDEAVRAEMGARYVDASAFLERAGNAPDSWRARASRGAVGDYLLRVGLDVVSAPWKDADAEPRYTSKGPLAILALDDDYAVAWVRGPRGPLVVDLRMLGTWLSERLRAEFAAKSDVPPPQELMAAADRRAKITVSKDNIRSLLMFLIARRAGRVNGGWPPYSGKNFILSVVARHDLDLRHAMNREILFSPGGPEARPDRERFDDATRESLKKVGSFGDLTHYAGRRNADAAFRITPDLEAQGTPLIADLHFDGIAIVGFSSGDVRVMERKDLGLGPDDPIRCGDESKSALLRMLSDR